MGTTVPHIFENSEIVKNSTAPKQELNCQSFVGFSSVCVALFFGVWFLDGFGNELLVVWGGFCDPFWLPKSIKNGIDFAIDFNID